MNSPAAEQRGILWIKKMFKIADCKIKKNVFDVIHKKFRIGLFFWNMDLNTLLKPTVRKEENEPGIL